MLEPIKFTVYGAPQSAGSKQSFVPVNKKTGQPFRSAKTGRIVVNTVDDNPKSKDWQKLVAYTAQQHRPPQLLAGAISLSLTFVRPRLKGHFRANGELSKAGLEAPWPTTKPDVLKLARAVEDALTGVIWVDDAQICDERLRKVWGAAACVIVEIAPLSAQTELAQTELALNGNDDKFAGVDW